MQQVQVTKDDEVKLVVEKYAKEKDPAKKAELKQQLDAEITKRKAVEAEVAKRPAPRYPVGLAATLGSNKAVVTAATYEPTGWRYSIVINPGAIFMTTTLVKTEAEVKQLLAEQVKQAAGPAYPRGVLFFRNGQGGLIEDVKPEGGTFSYQVKGWPNRVTEEQLAAILGK